MPTLDAAAGAPRRGVPSGPEGHVSEAFRAAEHIRQRADFERVYNQGARLGGRFMTMFVGPAPGDTPRLGVAATRKLGNAVVRNRAKRLVREMFRRHKRPVAFDIVVVPRRELLDAPFASLEAEFCALLDRHARRRHRA